MLCTVLMCGWRGGSWLVEPAAAQPAMLRAIDTAADAAVGSDWTMTDVHLLYVTQHTHHQALIA